MPFISVIVPNYNHARFLEQRIQSILNQTCQDFELILMDDFSTDGSQDILKTYANHPKTSVVLLNDKNSGSTFKQWKKGLVAAKGEWIWIAESDDYSHPEFLSTLKKLLTPETGLAFCNSFRVNETNSEVQAFLTVNHGEGYDEEYESHFRSKGINFLRSHLIYNNSIPNASAVLMRKSLLEKVDFENITMKVAGDWYIYSLLAQASEVTGVFQPLNYYRFHDTTVRAKRKYNAEGIKDILFILEHIAGILNFQIHKLPHTRPYFLVEWYIECLTHSPVFSTNFIQLAGLYKTLLKINRQLPFRIKEKYVYLLKVKVKTIIFRNK